MRLTNIFKGLGVALVTPFQTDGNVDFSALEKLVASHLQGSTDFLCVLGTTAETPCLTLEEKRQIIRAVVKQVDKRMPILLGCGGNNTAEVIRFLKEENLEGVDGVLIVAPYYNKPSQEGLYQHFSAVAEATELPVVLYNVPGRTGVNIEASTTLRIAADHENVVAVKEASGKLSQIEEILLNAPKGFEVLSGDDGITFELLSIGAVGVISVIGNAYPNDFADMVHQTLQGNMTEALQLHRRFDAFYKLMTVDGNPSGVKALLAVQGKINNILRLPLVPVRPETLKSLKNCVENF